MQPKQLKVWTKDSKQKVYSTLSQVLSRTPEIDLEVVAGESIPYVHGDSLIFCLGDLGKPALQEVKAIPKNRTTGSLRNQLHSLPMTDCNLMFSYNCGIGEIDYSKHIDLLCDTGMAIRYAMTGSLDAKLGHYRYVPDFNETIAAIDKLYAETGKPVPVELDLETIGLDPYALPTADHPGARIVSIQITYQAGMSDVVYFASREEEESKLADFQFMLDLSHLLNSPKISLGGANLKFDLHWIARRGKIKCTNFKFDTTLVGSMLDENRVNGLDVHAKIYVPSLGGYSDQFDLTIDKSRMDQVPPERLLPYAGGDTDACHQVRQAMTKELLADPAATAFYVNILHPAARAFEALEQGGVCVDMDAYKELEADLLTEMTANVKRAKAIMGGRLCIKHHDPKQELGLNLTKASLLKDFMFSPMGLNLKPKMMTEKSGEPSTAMDHLLMFEDDPAAKEFINIIKAYASSAKTLGTYVRGFQKHLRSDGRFHPSYFFFVGDRTDDEGGTNTGRLSCKGPAFQCMVGETMVMTHGGEQSLLSIFNGYSNGRDYRVLTHTGQWRDVVGVYQNGVQPIFELKFSNGSAIKCTGNHPILTDKGWVRTDQLKEGVTAYASKGYRVGTSNSGVHQSNVLLMDGNEESVSVSVKQRLEGLRREGDSSLRTMAFLPEFSCGYGGEAGSGLVNREGKGQRQLRAGELQVGAPTGASQQPSQHEAADAFGQDSDRGTVGYGVRNQPGTLALSAGDWDVHGASIEEGMPANRDRFQEVTLLSITPCGEVPTYDLTVKSSHSFVANGIVVHNTIPKHTTWGKRIRRCFPAPPGYVVCERDYSQGELKVIACVANEENMIQAYLNDMDLHSLTAGPFRGYSYEDMMAMKKLEETDPVAFHLYEEIRQLGKAGNFGLIYGMGEDGFYDYAINNYGVTGFTRSDAGDFRNNFFLRYPQLIDYHTEYKAFARKHGFVRSPLGRVRHLPLINSKMRDIAAKAERQSINAPIQGTLNDMLLWAAALSHAQGWDEVCPAFGAVHDAMYNYIPEDKVDFYVRRELDNMENLPFDKVGWNPRLKFTADAKIGPTMADLKKFKG